MMARIIKGAAAVSLLLTLLFAVLYSCGIHWALSAAITFGTFFYHFSMRLLVGHIIDRTMQNQADCSKAWYQLSPFEKKLYRMLKVKKWKGHMPTYDPSLFDFKRRSPEQIAQAMCQAEIVHEIIVVLSFLPLLAAIPFGEFWVFFATSLLAALYDLCFVVMQRFNRPRILKLIKKERV